MAVRIEGRLQETIPLITTNADCENTATETDIITVTIPANSLAVGDIIEISYNFRRHQNSGTSKTLTQRLKINSTAIYSNSTSLSTGTAIWNITQKQQLIVTELAGNNITFKTYTNNAANIITRSNAFAICSSTTTSGADQTNRTVGSIDRTAIITIELSAQWASANVNAYIRNDGATAYIIKKVV